MPDVVSLGVHILDVLGRPVERIPPKQDIDLLEEIRLTVAGTAAGTSVDLAKLGASVLAMGAIGGKGQSDGTPDAAGQFILDTMGRYGIDTGGLRVKPGVQTSATMLPIRPNGERPALHVLGANAELARRGRRSRGHRPGQDPPLRRLAPDAQAGRRTGARGAQTGEGRRRHRHDGHPGRRSPGPARKNPAAPALRRLLHARSRRGPPDLQARRPTVARTWSGRSLLPGARRPPRRLQDGRPGQRHRR